MRRARNIRVSSARDVCVFCATRQLAAVAVSQPQRRQLNSSSKDQYEESQLFKEERAPARPMTQAEKMRQALAKQYVASQPQQQQQQQQPRAMSQADRAKAAMKSQYPARQQPPSQPGPRIQSQAQSIFTPKPQAQSQFQPRAQPQGQFQRRPPQRAANSFDDLGQTQNQRNDRYTPNRGNAPQNRYNVNMNSTPPPVAVPQFGSANLRPRNDIFGFNAESPIPTNATQSQPPSQTRPLPLRPQLDQDELARLLGDNSKFRKSERSQYTPLSRQARPPMKCFNCGKEGHRGNECPERTTSRQQYPQASQQFYTPRSKQESVAEAAEAWARTKGATLKESAQSPGWIEEQERRKVQAEERRRSRFRMEEENTVQTRNRYEEPQRRQRSDNSRRARGRVMREEDEEAEERVVSKAERKRLREEAKKKALLEREEPIPIVIPEYISVANLAGLLRLRVEDFVKKLEELGFEEVQNDHILNAEHAGLIAEEYNYAPIIQAEGEDGDLYPAPALSPEEYTQLPVRPPVVTIMGHVDHGKTTVLDYIRSTSVAAGEFGGITQHIGAFSVALGSGKKITFLDTPGHAAFETMRARGANVTDIVVLVVAADDSVMPQTVEAIKHAQAAGVPIIVAINKIDKQQADPARVKLDLGRHGIEVEEFGGDVQVVEVSGKTGQGIPDLEDAITLLSEVLDHRADPGTSVEGWVLEGTTKKSGRVATVLVRSGTLRKGDVLVAGNTWARVRTLHNEAGVVVDSVGPGMPVEVDGWREQPVAGDEVLQAADEQQATEVSDLRVEKSERVQMAKDMEAINESRRLEAERRAAEEAAEQALKRGEDVDESVKEVLSGPELVSFVVKADVSGSVEAVIDSISSIGNNEVGTRVLRSGVGSPSEFDVKHAADANGHIVNFNTTVPQNIAAMAADKGVLILDSNIIYRVVENVRALLSEKLPPKITQRVTGEAEIAAVFDIGLGGKKKLKVAGSKVRNGVIHKSNKAKVLRGDEVVFDGPLHSLKNKKQDVDQMRKDTECGIAFEGWEDFQVGDKVQCYEEKSEKRTL